jgi:hypothetical protein
LPILDIEKEKFIKMFLDYDKSKKKFYINYFFEEDKIVLKEPLIKEKNQGSDFKFDNFNLTKYTYLIHF